MTRPALREIPLDEAVPLKGGTVTVTMSPGQWDALLQAAYDGGFVLLELDDDEQPVSAYHQGDGHTLAPPGGRGDARTGLADREVWNACPRER